jgi:uncharacterized protein (DUF486 family)
MAPSTAFANHKIRHRRLESRWRRSVASPPEEPAEPVSATVWTTVVLLLGSNIFMTFAWYAHLRNLHDKAWYIAAFTSWGIALFEYLLQVPANRLGYGTLNLAQLKILQEVITLSVFVPFAVFYMHQPVKSDYLWAGVCLLGAVYFIFRA